MTSLIRFNPAPERRRLKNLIQSWAWCRNGDLTLFTYLQNHPQWMEAGELLWKTRHKFVRRLTVPPPCADWISGDVVYKFYGEKRFWRYFLRPSLAAREIRGYRFCEKLGLPTAHVLAGGEFRRGFRLLHCFLMTQMVEACHDGDRLLPGAEFGDRADWRLAFAQQNIVYLARLHSAGGVHGNFHPRNELFRVDAQGKLEVIWIDLATCRVQRGRAGEAQRQRDLNYFLEVLALPGGQTAELRQIYAQTRAEFATRSAS